MLRALVILLLVLVLPASTHGVGPVENAVPDGAMTHPLRPLPFHYDLYTFRGDGGSTTVVAAFAVRAGRLEEERDRDAVRYRFDVSLVLADTAVKSVSRTDDSVFVRLPRPLEANHLLHTHVEVQAPPSESILQRVVMTDASEPGIGQLYTTPFPIRDYSGDHLMLSDVALGLPRANAGWERGGVRLALLPTSRFPESSFDVYYEVYNLPPEHPYATEITVEPLTETGEPAGEGEVNLRFSGESPADSSGALPELRNVQTSLPRGRYRLTVTVRDQSTGAVANRSRTFEVREWGPGATLVPALPRQSPLAVLN